MDGDRELFAIFRAEVEEQIEDLCGLLERAPERWRVPRLFQISHNVKGAARLVGVAPVRDAAHALEDLFAALRDGAELAAPVVALARAGADLLSACFESIDGGGKPDVDGYRQQVNGWLRGHGGPVRSATGVAGGASRPGAEAPGPVDDPPREEAGVRSTADTPETLRVATAKIDALMEVSSELVSLVFQLEGHRAAARELVSRMAGALQSDRQLGENPAVRETLTAAQDLHRQIRDHAGDSLRLSDELQASVRSLRMVRMEGLRTMAGQTIRATCRDTGKAARLRMLGADTEVDRVVLEHLRDPLVHLLRNAVAHGVEPPEQRVAVGKEASGTVSLQATAVGEWVLVTVSDDGRGIDPDRVRASALAKGAAAAEELAAMDEAAVLDLLFSAGLSTSDAVTEVAGRGVGLDVVRNRLRALGGSATISSRLGHGTEVLLRVPLTRLTTTGILVRAGDRTVAIPSGWVERTMRVSRDQLQTADGADALALDDGLVRIASLGRVLGLELSEAPSRPAVLLSDGTRRRALLVDAVLGQREYIAQPLAWNLRGAPGLAGCTVLDGSTVVPILDPPVLLGDVAGGNAWKAVSETRRSRLLVVDDSATSRTLERNILRTAGYEVVTAVSGKGALEVLTRQEVDLVVSDVEMPEVNGFELTRRIRADARWATIPVVLVTSLGSDDHQQEGAEAGADAYIVKGAFDQDELLTTVARLL